MCRRLYVSDMFSKYKKFDDRSHREGQCSCECSDGHIEKILCQTWLHKIDRKIEGWSSLPAPIPRISSRDLGLTFFVTYMFLKKVWKSNQEPFDQKVWSFILPTNTINYIKSRGAWSQYKWLFFHFLNLFNSLEQRFEILIDVGLIFFKLLFCLLK